MKCLLKYQLDQTPPVINYRPERASWAYGLAWLPRAAFRSGKATYCGYINEVTVGTWAGGIVGLKSIMGMKRRQQALEMMDRLADLSYIGYTLDPKIEETYIQDHRLGCKVLWRALYGP